MASQASISSDAFGGEDIADDVSFTSDVPGPTDPAPVTTRRRHRWTFQLKRKAEDPTNPLRSTSNEGYKGLSVSCRCKGAINGLCLITTASFCELIGNLIWMILSIAFILNVCNFYELEFDPTDPNVTKVYEDRLDDVVYLSQNTLGFIGLLAVACVGLIVSFILPVGTSLKSWKILYASMSLLFAMCLTHVILALCFINGNMLYSIAILPFRIYEFFLIWNYIRYNKRKHREEVKPCLDGVNEPCDSSSPGGQVVLEGGVLSAVNGADQGLVPLPGDQQQVDLNAMQVTFDLSDGDINGQDKTKQLDSDLAPANGEEFRQQRRRHRLFRVFQGERKPRIGIPSYTSSRPERDRYNEITLDMK